MKRTGLLILSLLFFGVLLSQEVRTVKNEAFKSGEILKYRVYYDAFLTGEVNAGTAVLQVDKEIKKIAGRDVFHIKGVGKSKGAFNLFFKVEDYYETFMDTQMLAPWLFIRRVSEGGYTASQDVIYNQYKNQAYFKDNKRKKSSTVETPPYIHDIISAFYYARTLDFSKAKINDEFPVQFMFDDSVYTSKIVFLGVENIKVSAGTFRCLKFKPMVLTGNVFSDPYPLTLYITDDKNRVPIFAVSSILVGKVKLEITDFEGLANPITSLIVQPKKKR